jgi:hypothetical protein
MATYYLNAGSTGANDGSSWANAFTDAQDAVDALESGDTLLIDGVIYDGIPQINGLDNITIDGGQGPSGSARLMGVLPVDESDITDEGGGVFSIALAAAPPTVTWDYQADNTDGSVTGVTTNRDDIAILYQGVSTQRPVVNAWYGHLPRNATFATTTPAEGFWGFSGGRVYVNPPGSPTIAQVASSLGVGVSSRGIYLQACDNATVRNFHAVGFGNPNPSSGSFFFIGCRDLTITDCTSNDAGYRSFNFEGDTGDTDPLGLVATRCIAIGDCVVGSNQNNFFVVYNGSGTTEGGLIRDSAAVAHPWLDTTGRPILGSTSGQTAMSQTYKPAIIYSHANGGSPTMDGIVFERFSMLSMCQPLNEKHHPTATLGMFWPDEKIGFILAADRPVYDATDPDAYPVQIKGGVVYGNISSHCNVALRGVRAVTPEPMGGLANYSAASTVQNQWVSYGEALEPIYYESCEMFFRAKGTANGIWFMPNRSSQLYMDLCTVVYDVPSPISDGDPFVYATAGGSGQDGTIIRMRGCVFYHQGASNRNDRQFIKRNGAFTPNNDYDQEIFGRWEIEACWWHNFSAITDFNRGGGAGGSPGFKGEEYVEFADNDGGSPLNALGLFISQIGPGFVNASNGDIRPAPGGNLDTTTMADDYEDIEGIIGIGGGLYSGRYGAYQGGPAVVDGTLQVNVDGSVSAIYTKTSGLWGDTITDDTGLTITGSQGGVPRTFTVDSIGGEGEQTLRVELIPSPVFYTTASGSITMSIPEGKFTDENGNTNALTTGIADGNNSSTRVPPSTSIRRRLTGGSAASFSMRIT